MTKDNFTFSSKYIIGTFLVLNEENELNQIHQLDENYKKYDIFNEDEILSKLNLKITDSIPMDENLKNQQDHKLLILESKRKEKYLQREKKHEKDGSIT